MGEESVPTKGNCPCLAKCAANEPIFVLRAQDKTAPAAVQTWIDKNIKRLGAKHPKITGAKAVIKAMKSWPIRKLPD